MKAITVRYMPATNSKPSRWKASAHGVKSVVLFDDHGLTAQGNAIKAAKVLAHDYLWEGKMAIGTDAKGDYQVVFVTEDCSFTL